MILKGNLLTELKLTINGPSFTMGEVENDIDHYVPTMHHAHHGPPANRDFVTELQPEAMFFLEAEPVTMSIPELEAATMSVPEGVLIQFAILQWCPPAFPASKLFLCQSHLAGVRS